VKDIGINCASEILVIGLAMNSSLQFPASAEGAQKSPLQKNSNNMFFIILRAVQIGDRLSRSAGKRARLGEIALRLLSAFALKQCFSLFDSAGRRSGASDGNPH
jgi:hypothetical protein